MLLRVDGKMVLSINMLFGFLGYLGFLLSNIWFPGQKKKKNQKILNSLTLHAKSVISVNLLLDLNMKNLDFNTV